jgi:hypothetical protein
MNKRRFLLSRLIKEEIERSSSQGFQDALGEESQRLAASGFRIAGKAGEPSAKPSKIDRRKLDLIAKEDENAVLHLWELRVLASYFERTRKVDFSRTPIFERTTIYEPLAQAPRVSFLFGLRPESTDQSTSLRLWDFRSMTVIADEIHRLAPQTELDWQLIDPSQQQPLGTKPDNSSLITIGSPRANMATEILLARMFGIEPFKQGSGASKATLPFQFIWPMDVRSAFASPPGSLASPTSRTERAALERGLASAMVIKGKHYLVNNSYTDASIPGVIVAQRLLENQIVVVAAGLSGPATFGAANLLKDFTADLPLCSSGGRANVLMWAALEVHVVADPKRSGDPRVPDRFNFIHPPEIWSRKA